MATVACPTCSAAYDNPKLKPGTQFSCGGCGTVLTVPAPGEMLTLEPLDAAEDGPPVIEPKPQPPVVQPKSKAPVVQPKPKAPVVQPKATAPVVQAKATAPAPAPGLRRSPTSVGRRAQSTVMDQPAQPEKKRISPVVWASSFLAAAAIILIVVMMSGGGPTEAQRAQAYTAGYLAGHKSLVKSDFGSRSRKDRDLYARWAKKIEEPSEIDFMAGVKDAKGQSAPKLNAAEINAERFKPDLLLSLMDEKFPGDRAETAYAASHRYDQEKERWEGRGAPRRLVKMLAKRSKEMMARVLEHDPNFAEIREAREEARYENQLEQYIGADWLSGAEKQRAKRDHEYLTKLAAKNSGWVKKTALARVAKREAEFAPAKKDYEEMTNSPFGKLAMEMASTVSEEVNQIFAKARDWPPESVRKDKKPEDIEALRKRWLKNVENRTFTVRIQKPYVVFVEESDAWDPTQVTRSLLLQPLGELNETFLSLYQKKYNLAPLEKPIPVVFLRNTEGYMQYMAGHSGAPNRNVLAHFEPTNGRLVLNGDTNFTTKLHEGTHQLFYHYTKNTPSFTEQSFWFNEGVAEWFSGARRTPNPKKQGAWQYEIGLLQVGRFRGISSFFGRSKRDQPGTPLSLEKLLTCTYATRAVEPWTTPAVYAQGWMLIYFCNYFKVDAEGYVLIDTKKKPVEGMYKEGWERYVGMELNGETGKAAFMKAMKVDDAGLKKMADNFEKYQKWILKKINIKQVSKKRLVPALEWRTSKGKLAGLKSDDLLVPPKKTNTDDE